jgi:hypothetical protein
MPVDPLQAARDAIKLARERGVKKNGSVGRQMIVLRER